MTVPSEPITIGITVIFIIIITVIIIREIFTALADGLSLKLEWQQIPQVFRTLLSILADLNNVVV